MVDGRFLDAMDTFMEDCGYEPPEIDGFPELLEQLCESEGVASFNQTLVVFEQRLFTVSCVRVDGSDLYVLVLMSLFCCGLESAFPVSVLHTL